MEPERRSVARVRDVSHKKGRASSPPSPRHASAATLRRLRSRSGSSAPNPPCPANISRNIDRLLRRLCAPNATACDSSRTARSSAVAPPPRDVRASPAYPRRPRTDEDSLRHEIHIFETFGTLGTLRATGVSIRVRVGDRAGNVHDLFAAGASLGDGGERRRESRADSVRRTQHLPRRLTRSLFAVRVGHHHARVSQRARGGEELRDAAVDEDEIRERVVRAIVVGLGSGPGRVFPGASPSRGGAPAEHRRSYPRGVVPRRDAVPRLVQLVASVKVGFGASVAERDDARGRGPPSEMRHVHALDSRQATRASRIRIPGEAKRRREGLGGGGGGGTLTRGFARVR